MENSFGLAVEGQLEAVGQEGAEHGHLLVVAGADFAGGYGDDVVVAGVNPVGAAEDGSRVEIVGGGDEELEGVVLFDEAIGALHGDVAAVFCFGIDGFDGGYFEGVEPGAWGLG